jgi:hypothetical protein
VDNNDWMSPNRIVAQGGGFAEDIGSWVVGYAWVDLTASKCCCRSPFPTVGSVQAYRCPPTDPP